MIVESERPDLMEEHREASNSTFDNIKLLKDTETALLSRLADASPRELLKDDSILS
jgi:hypothetical protein